MDWNCSSQQRYVPNGSSGCGTDEMTNIKGYIERIEQRPAFQKAMAS